jgi:hypothetical protein
MQFKHVYSGYTPDARVDPRIRIHAASELNGLPLCVTSKGFEHLELFHESSLPVDCGKCTKAIEMIARHALTSLSASQLEDVLELARKLRSNEVARNHGN